MNNKAVFILSVALAFVLGFALNGVLQRCASAGCGAGVACERGAGGKGACDASCAKACCKPAKADCCARTAAGDAQECCAKHERGETQECCAKSEHGSGHGMKGEAAGMEITGEATGGQKDCCPRDGAK